MTVLDPYQIIAHYYRPGTLVYHILVEHSERVAQLALALADRLEGQDINRQLLYEAAMLHDIGIVYTDAMGISCYGREPYVRHGYLGATLLRRDWGLEVHARVCERHTGSGVSEEERITLRLPLPKGIYLPETLEEKLICYADCFYSKTHLNRQKGYEEVRQKMMAFWQRRAPKLAPKAIARLEAMHQLFGDPALISTEGDGHTI